jgi:hypothetical protein
MALYVYIYLTLSSIPSSSASDYMMSQILTSQAAPLMMPHPILQQIQNFNMMYPNTGVVLQQQGVYQLKATSY